MYENTGNASISRRLQNRLDATEENKRVQIFVEFHCPIVRSWHFLRWKIRTSCTYRQFLCPLNCSSLALTPCKTTKARRTVLMSTETTLGDATSVLSDYLWCTYVTCFITIGDTSLRDGPLEKLWGGGGRGIFELQEFFFVIKFLVWIFFRPLHEYFLGLIGLHEFFFI